MSKKKKKPPFNLNSAIRSAVRRLFAKSPSVFNVMRLARREVPRRKKNGEIAKKPSVQYLCGVCKSWHGSTKISVDHIEPVISVDVGFVDWNTFIQRLFCDESNLQVICDDCHAKKTQAEKIARLAKQYDRELDDIEAKLHPENLSVMLAFLQFYVQKKKISGLEAIAERAEKLQGIIRDF